MGRLLTHLGNLSNYFQWVGQGPGGVQKEGTCCYGDGCVWEGLGKGMGSSLGPEVHQREPGRRQEGVGQVWKSVSQNGPLVQQAGELHLRRSGGFSDLTRQHPACANRRDAREPQLLMTFVLHILQGACQADSTQDVQRGGTAIAEQKPSLVSKI